jgi:hypothetical protein
MGGLSIKRIKRTIIIRDAEDNIPANTNIFLRRPDLTSKNLSKKTREQCSFYVASKVILSFVQRMNNELFEGQPIN